MTFEEIASAVKSNSGITDNMFNPEVVAYFILEDIKILKSTLSETEYKSFKQAIDYRLNFIKRYLDTEHRWDEINQNNKKRLIAIGQLYKQAVDENNALAKKMGDIYNGIINPV